MKSLFSVIYKNRFLEYVIDGMDAGNTIGDLIKNFSLKDGIDMVKLAWQEIGPNTIFHCWKNLLNKCAAYQHERALRSIMQEIDTAGPVQRTTSLARQVEDVNETDIRTWLDDPDERVTSQIFSHTDLVNFVKYASLPAEYDMQQDSENESVTEEVPNAEDEPTNEKHLAVQLAIRNLKETLNSIGDFTKHKFLDSWEQEYS